MVEGVVQGRRGEKGLADALEQRLPLRDQPTEEASQRELATPIWTWIGGQSNSVTVGAIGSNAKGISDYGDECLSIDLEADRAASLDRDPHFRHRRVGDT
jgi:hypothetical protein